MKRIILALFFLSTVTVIAQTKNTSRQEHFNLDDKLALEGYDVVSYFNEDTPKEGDKTFSTTYKGVQYYFVTNENKSLFLSNPEAYEPQYGGWCAYAMGAKGDKVSVDPETYKIIDGKLYLFYNAYFNNTLKSWNKNEQSLKEKADTNWSSYYKAE